MQHVGEASCLARPTRDMMHDGSSTRQTKSAPYRHSRAAPTWLADSQLALPTVELSTLGDISRQRRSCGKYLNVSSMKSLTDTYPVLSLLCSTAPAPGLVERNPSLPQVLTSPAPQSLELDPTSHDRSDEAFGSEPSAANIRTGFQCERGGAP